MDDEGRCEGKSTAQAVSAIAGGKHPFDVVEADDKETMEGPGGIRIELDPKEIVPEDPGQGTPRMVCLGKSAGTLDCAIGEKELGCGDAVPLTDEQHKWLLAQQEYCDKWLDEQYDRICQQKETGG
jgi:hypothetical protein